MSVNKNHPDFLEYSKKAMLLAKRCFAEEDEILAKYPAPLGKDEPATKEILVVKKKYNQDLKKLQKEYHHLFE